MSIENLSLLQLQQFEQDMPQLAGFPSRVLATSYDDFIKILYFDIDKIIFQIEENPELRQHDKEDRLTIDIKNQLCCMGYNASHDTKIGGHADLVVKKDNFTWIGEAKIHGAYDYLWEGFLQLTTRYSTGDSNQRDGGILIYIRNEDVSSIMENWKTHLLNKKLPDYSYEPCKNRELSFFSTHKHQVSGKDFKVRHMPVMLYFQPQDKSGRARSKKKA